MTIGEEYLIQFREDLKWLIYENNTKFNHWSETNRTLQHQTHEGLKVARSTRWNKYAFGLGVMGIILSVLWSLGTAVSVAALVVSFIGGLHKATVDVLIFDRPYKEFRNRRLKFMSAWNRGVMTSWKAMMILPLGILIHYAPGMYKIGLWVLDDMMAEYY